jgi:hypothetical protein
MNDKLIFDLTFPRNYDVAESELPGHGQPVIYQPGASSSHGKDGILLRFRPCGAHEWLGCFAFGHYSSYAFSGVFSTPNPAYTCVISNGRAYWVNAGDPSDCSTLNLFPVLNARCLSDLNVLLINDFVSVGVVDGGGVLWRSPRLCWDELRIMEIAEGVASGVGYDPLNSQTWESDFKLDLRSRTVLKSGYPRELGPL